MILCAGIDFSLTSPAICTFKGDKWTLDTCNFHYLTSTKKHAVSVKNKYFGTMHKAWVTKEERFAFITDWAIQIVWGCDYVLLENYAFAGKGKVFDIAECTGLLKQKMYLNNIKFDVVAPTTIKKFATGKGNATKEDMYEAFLGQTSKGHKLQKIFDAPNPEKVGSPVSDIVDSYFICKYYHIHRKVIDDEKRTHK
jgi:Holliday junction resolvasome RuvABC endonuclease subunit